MENKCGLLVVMSAPSGCGKDTVFAELKKIRSDIVESVSATTRKPREGEINGVNYYFKTDDEFLQMINDGKLLEYARYNNCYYGTPVEGVEKAIAKGKICFLIIEVEGAQNIMKMIPDCVSIFLSPPSLDELRRRLHKRSTDSHEDIENRIRAAEYEMEMSSLYKYNVVNDVLEDCVETINNILNDELAVRNDK
ncbi:MAG: guanylate kinase [Eubacterium sp.]|nr:guanylate kinase [Eubacterium sp.]MBR0413325.1 guanylate kinase [Eubacterium sp.]